MVPVLRPIVAALALAAVVAASGCPRGRALQEALRTELSRADVAWRDRDTGGFGPVEDALAAAEALIPGHPEVGWRRVRLGIARGLEADDPVRAVRAFASARDAGMTCARGADAPPSSDVADTLRRAGEGTAPCVDWTALAWARWLEAFGPEAGALDVERIDALLAWSAARPPLGGAHGGVAAWAEGILWAVRPDGPDLERAAERLRGVVSERGDDAVVALDLLRLVAEPSGDEPLARDLAASLRQVDLDTPEERGAVGRWRITSTGSP